MLRVIVAAAVLGSVVIACTTASKTYGPSGAVAYSINCSGPRHSWSDCYEKAGNSCGAGGYAVVSKSDDDGPGVSVNARPRTVYDFERVLLVECKN
jgi:hypothetical protein